MCSEIITRPIKLKLQLFWLKVMVTPLTVEINANRIRLQLLRLACFMSQPRTEIDMVRTTESSIWSSI